MILITHYDECRQTIQLVHASAKIAGETVAQYRARLLPVAQDHASRIVHHPEYIDWDCWVSDGMAYDSSADDIYTITVVRSMFTVQRRGLPKDFDPSVRIITEAQAVERKARWDAEAERLRALHVVGGRRGDRP